MAIVQEFDLNMIPDSAPVIVHVNQYDEGEGRFEIHLYDGNVPYVPAAGAEAIIQGTKPDGKGFDYNATLSGSTVTADVTKQMTAVAGVVRVQVVITEGDDVTGTFVFGMDVQKSGLPADTDMSASEYQVVMQLLETAEGINNNPPKIGANGHWWVWDASTGAYVDSGVDASISVEIADITMLLPDATPYVTNTGTDTDPIFHLFIPRGQTGTGISSISKTGTSGYVDTYTVTYTDGSTSQFEITNGRNTDQVTAIPTASAALVGTIYQYIGASTSSYTHGFYYECVNDGGVYKWVNIPVGNDPVAVNSTDPYTYRQGKGNLADIEIEGASVGWNQLIPNKSTTTKNGITFTVDNTAHTITISGTASATAQLVFYEDSINYGFKGITDHKYLFQTNNKGLTQNSITYKFISNGGFTDEGSLTNTQDYIMTKCKNSEKGAGILLRVTSGTAISTPVVVHYPNLIDLTQAFNNPTVADAIYAMETAQVGSGIAFFRKYFSKDYYAYDAGSIQSVCIASRKVVGKNLFDPSQILAVDGATYNGEIYTFSKDKMTPLYGRNVGGFYPRKFAPNTQYTFSVYGYNSRSNFSIYIQHTDGSEKLQSNMSTTDFTKLTITSDAGKTVKMIFFSYASYGTTYWKEPQLEIGSTATPYEPYTSTAYPFDSTKQLRGLFSLVGGELKANGDIYTADGNIQRKYGIVTFDGSSDENWTDYSSGNGFRLSISDMKSGEAQYGISNYLCMVTNLNSLGIEFGRNDTRIYIAQGLTISGVTDLATWKTYLASHPLTVVYPLATPTTESAQPYQNPQRAYIDGTEEFTDGLTRDVMIPVGNNTTYQQDKILPSVEDYVDAVAEQKSDISAIGTNEDKATASQAYTVGQHFYKDGKFCTVIANIASGGTFTLNTNYVEGTIAQAIEAINVSGGHTIVNSSGTDMASRSKLKFANAAVTDDPANDQTIITNNPASSRQEATLNSGSFTKASQASGVYYVTRGGYCEVHIINIVPKSTGQGLLVASGLPRSMYDGIIMGGTPNFEDGTAFYVRTDNNVTNLYALIPDTNSKQGTVSYMMMN